jgi:hypothetical protein
MLCCKVSFFDLEHQITRKIDVRATSPLEAAHSGLQWMKDHDFFPEDFGPSVRVEVITSLEHKFSVASLNCKSVADKVA